MQTIKRIGGGVLLGGSIFLLVLLIGGDRLRIPTWLQVAGRLHPLFLHFPIVLLLISFMVLWLPLKENEENEWLDLLRLGAALSAMITAIMGLFLSLENDKSGSVLQWHKWGGVTIAFAACLFYLFYSSFMRQRALGKLFTTFGAVLIILTSHWGGDLTHGDHYLLAPMDQKKQAPLQEALVFDDVIRPVLEKKCFSCHGGSISKGGLSMQTWGGVMKGGKTGPLFVPGFPDASLLIQRIHLPVEEKKHMPPVSKPPLTAEESDLLSAWIRAGAPDDKRLISLPSRDSFRLLAITALTAGDEAGEEMPVYGFPPADEKKIASLNNNFRVIEPQGLHSPALAVYFYGRNMYSGKALEELLPLKEQIITLSLARMPVKDDQLKTIQEMPNLQKLNLDYTDITGAGLQRLAGLRNLKQLDLSGTAVTADGLENILNLPELSLVVIWNTRLDSGQAKAMGVRHRRVHLETGFIDNGQLIVALSPPLIQMQEGVFDTSLRVEMKHPFRGVDIRYTLDGTAPDSLTSALYKGPVDISGSATLLARAFKKGWEGSPAARSLYIKRGLRPDSIELVSPPDPKYRGSGNLLSDRMLGELKVDDQQWLGYQKNEASCYLYFNSRVSVHSVLLNMLENTGAMIFPPETVEIWGGMEKKHLRLLAKINPLMPTRDTSAMRLEEKINFAPAALQCLKIIARPVAHSPIKPLPAVKVPPAVVKAPPVALKTPPAVVKAPPEKPVKSQPGWIFISEIVIN
jgi:uncharacterized membrane protein